MSHTTKIKGDPGINIDIEIRRNRAFTVNWKHFSDDSHTVPYDIEDVFRLIVKPTPDSADSEAIIDVTSADTLSIDGHVISYSFTAENTNQDRTQLWYELINTTSGQNWYQGFMPIKRGKASDDLDTDVESTINVGDVTIEVTVTLAGGGGGEESTFTSNPTLVLPSGHTFGKYANGDTPNWTGLTAIEAILDAITDYINAVFTSFSISGQSTTVEVGTTLSGSKTFTWAITENSSDVNDLDIYDITAAANIATATANDGSQAVTITSKQLNSNGATQQWRGVAHDDNNDNDINSTTYTVTARYKAFYGPADAVPTDSAGVRALPSSVFVTGAMTIDMETGTEKTTFPIGVPPGFVVASAIDLDAFSAPIEFTLDNSPNVDDAGGTSRAYKVYAFSTGVPYGTSHTIRITLAAA